MEFSLTYCVSLGSVTICLHAINGTAGGRAGSGCRGGWSLKLHCESAHLGASGHEAMNFALISCRTTSSASPVAFIASLPNWPCTFYVIGIMLETHPGVFLPWLCSFSLFLCFLFFLTHYVATFPSCVLCVSPISAFPSSSLCLGSPSPLHFSLPLPAPCLPPWSSHPPTAQLSPAGRCRIVVKGIDSGARLPGTSPFCLP